MTKIYFNIVKFLARDEYDFKARYFPAILFTIMLEMLILYKYQVEFDLGWLSLLKTTLFILFSLFIALIPKYIATVVSGYFQSLVWNNIGNPTINYIKSNDYKVLLNNVTEQELLSEMLKVTRKDRKLLSKNIFYGFFRNGSFLVFSFVLIDVIYLNFYVLESLSMFVIFIILLYISAQRYAEQITQSYMEMK
jgi:hypothetical protein